ALAKELHRRILRHADLTKEVGRSTFGSDGAVAVLQNRDPQGRHCNGSRAGYIVAPGRTAPGSNDINSPGCKILETRIAGQLTEDRCEGSYFLCRLPLLIESAQERTLGLGRDVCRCQLICAFAGILCSQV